MDICKTQCSEIAGKVSKSKLYAHGDLLDHNIFNMSLSTVSYSYIIVAFSVIILQSLAPLNKNKLKKN